MWERNESTFRPQAWYTQNSKIEASLVRDIHFRPLSKKVMVDRDRST